VEIKRIFKHLLYPQWLARRKFPDALLDRVEAAVTASERMHHGEIRVAVEAALDIKPLLRGVSARQRAVQVFAELGVWDTAANNGVLIYLLLADRNVEIVADRGFHGRVSQTEWETICREMEAFFARGEFAAGTLAGIEHIHALLRRHFPSSGDNPNELPNRPARI
jgi:uncharacterized membrane protein YgcG